MECCGLGELRRIAGNPYIIISYYDNDNGSGYLSGFTNENIAAFSEALKAFLKGQCASVDELAGIVLRPYLNMKVGPMGVAANLEALGGVKYRELDGSISIGLNARCIARLTDEDIVKSVYDWIKANYGTATAAVAEAVSVDVPAEADPAASDLPESGAEEGLEESDILKS